jgi:DedD protein
MRLPFLRSKPKPDAAAVPLRPASARAERARAAAAEGEGTEVAAARTRARRRLVGALVLLVIGIVGFPVLFETQPRPLPLDTPFELPRREGSVVAPPAPNKPRPVPVLPADAGTEVAVDAPSATPAFAPAAAASAAAVQAAPTVAIAPVVVPPTPVPAAAPAPAVRAPTLAPATVAPAAAAPAPAAPAGRFVVQVGAYSDPATLREARAKVEKLGLKTYTQVIDSDSGKRTRVRLGPFATREEADAAAAKVKRTGLPANIITL